MMKEQTKTEPKNQKDDGVLSAGNIVSQLSLLVNFIKWWEENVGDAAGGKYFYWDDKNRRKHKPETICKHYLAKRQSG